MQSAVDVVARAPVVDPIAIADIDLALSAIAPDGTLDKPRKDPRKRRIEGRGIDMSGYQVQAHPTVIASFSSLLSARALKRATETIPVVFLMSGDPVSLGIVPSLNRPTGNFTGVYVLLSQLAQKQLERLHELLQLGRTSTQ